MRLRSVLLKHIWMESERYLGNIIMRFHMHIKRRLEELLITFPEEIVMSGI